MKDRTEQDPCALTNINPSFSATFFTFFFFSFSLSLCLLSLAHSLPLSPSTFNTRANSWTVCLPSPLSSLLHVIGPLLRCNNNLTPTRPSHSPTPSPFSLFPFPFFANRGLNHTLLSNPRPYHHYSIKKERIVSRPSKYQRTTN